MAVIYGTKAKEEAKEIETQTNEQMVAEAISVENGETVEEPDVQRTLTITRAKKYAGCAVPIICYVNGEQVCMLKNGKSESIQVTGNSFELGATLKNGLAVGKVTVPAGTDALNYRVYVKWGMVVATLVVEPVINN